MDRQALQELLDAEGVSPRAFRLDGRLQEDSLILEARPLGAVVFYSERGQRGMEWTFDTEEQACEFLARELLADENNRYELVAGPAEDRTGGDLLDGWLAAHALKSSDLSQRDVREARRRT